jgi:hypothetical protein
MLIETAAYEDLTEILKLQHLAYQSEAILLQNFSIPPCCKRWRAFSASLNSASFQAVEGEEIIGSVRGRVEGSTLYMAS